MNAVLRAACSQRLSFGFPVALTLFFAMSAGASPVLPVVTIGRSDGPAVVYDYAKEHCEQWDVPDAPLRAFRNSQGSVVAFASDDKSRLLIGPALPAIRHTCHASFPSHERADASAYAGLAFITAVWTRDGKSVTALVHNEYHADHFPDACLFKDGMKCWYTTIVGARSTDGGQTFIEYQPPKVIAAVPFRQEVEQGRHRGFFNPSNILFHDGYYYMATDTTGGQAQKPGLCLFRTKTVENAASWRAFDGAGYGSRAIDPYRAETSAYVPCQPVDGPGTAGSISWHPKSGLFLIVYQSGGPEHSNGMTAYSWSADLIHWSPPHVLFDRPNMSNVNCQDTYRYGYPSILDAKAPGRNFDTIGDHPYLFLTQFHVDNCKLSVTRDLVRFKLDITR